MKKFIVSLVGLVLLAACAVAVVAPSAEKRQAAEPTATSTPPSLTPAPVSAEEYLTWADRADFGGLYYDEDGVLVVNIAGDISELEPRQGVRYKAVAYPLRELEAVKELLTNYMDDYAILTLDANEVTNRVDVCLQSYTQENMDQLRSLVAERYPDMDCLQFEDWSGMTISFT